jgi:hypothetical protein
LNTVYEFETERRTTTVANIVAMRRAIEAEGIRFLFDDAGAPAGIVLSQQGVRIDLSALPSD